MCLSAHVQVEHVAFEIHCNVNRVQYSALDILMLLYYDVFPTQEIPYSFTFGVLFPLYASLFGSVTSVLKIFMSMYGFTNRSLLNETR